MRCRRNALNEFREKLVNKFHKNLKYDFEENFESKTRIQIVMKKSILFLFQHMINLM